MRQAIVVLVASAGLVTAGQSPAGTGVIAGRVLDGATDQPVGGSIVTVLTEHDQPAELPVVPNNSIIFSDAGSQLAQVLTDADGRFVLRQLPSGALLVQARRPGWNSTSFGQHGPSDPERLVRLKDGEQRIDLSLHMWREGVLSGKVVDERGRPISNVGIRALAPTYAAGRRLWGGYHGATTDDRGEYEIAVPPGTFLVLAYSSSARANSQSGWLHEGRRWKYRPALYPDATTISQAVPVSVGPDEERRGIDFHLTAVPATRLSGSVVGAAAGVSGATVLAISRGFEDFDQRSVPIGVATSTDGNGRFMFASLPEGQYSLRALSVPDMPMMSHGIAPLRELPTGSTRHAQLTVSVEGAHLDVTLPTTEGARLRGEVRFTGAAIQPAADQLKNTLVLAEPADGAGGIEPDFRGTIHPDRRFTTIQLPPGRYVLRSWGLPSFVHASAFLNGRDITESPLEVADRDIDGIVIEQSGRPATVSGQISVPPDLGDLRTMVVLFPADRALWRDYGWHPMRLRTIRPDPRGTYRVASLQPGLYCMAAVAGFRGDLRDASLLQQLAPLAMQIWIADGQSHQQNLVAVRSPR